MQTLPCSGGIYSSALKPIYVHLKVFRFDKLSLLQVMMTSIIGRTGFRVEINENNIFVKLIKTILLGKTKATLNRVLPVACK